MTYNPNPTVCIIFLWDDIVAVFDDLPQPKVLGETLVNLLRQGSLGNHARKYFQEIVQAEWEWSELTPTIYRANNLRQGQTIITLTAEILPFFRSENKVTRSTSSCDDRETWG